MKVVDVGKGRARARLAAARIALALLILGAILLPGLLHPLYLPVLSTVLLVLVLLIVARAYLVAFVSFRRPREDPPAPAAWPTVSVLVPAYNEAPVLPRTMEALLRVDYPADRVEFVYVVERRSTDGTLAIAEAFAKRDPRFRVVVRDSERGGKAAATNFGLAHCRGELVLSLDADHSPAPDALKRAAARFAADPEIACLKGRCIGINGHESVLALFSKVERDAAEKGDLYGRDILRSFTMFGGGQAVFRRSVFEELGPFDEEILVEDIDYSVRMHRAGLKLAVDPRVVTFEENPATLKAWWAQRYRWARGWMQVARRYLPVVHRLRAARWPVKLDLYHTLAYVLVPVFFVLVFPLNFLSRLGVPTAPLVPVDALIAASTTCTAAAFVLHGAIWAQDARDGVKRRPVEVVPILLFWPYIVFQTAVFWAAFVDEFVLRRPSVYVKTSKSGAASAAPRSAAGAVPAVEATAPGAGRRGHA